MVYAHNSEMLSEPYNTAYRGFYGAQISFFSKCTAMIKAPISLQYVDDFTYTSIEANDGQSVPLLVPNPTAVALIVHNLNANSQVQKHSHQNVERKLEEEQGCHGLLIRWF